MADLPQFYKKVVPISEKAHRDWRVRADHGYSFAATTNAVMLATIEFPPACREYPIVFVAHDGSVRPVAVLGMKRNQNLFLKMDGSWDARYLPAYVRRYPFILAADPKRPEQFTICIDESFSGFNREQGESLFTAWGQQSDYLKRATGFLRDFQVQGRRTEEFCQRLTALEVLAPMQANISASSGEKFSVAGFQVVSREKLAALKPAKLAELIKSGDLELIYQHLTSLTNFQRVTDLMAVPGLR
jgi:hypothetical protein